MGRPGAAALLVDAEGRGINELAATKACTFHPMLEGGAASVDAMRAELDDTLQKVLLELGLLRNWLIETYLPACRDTVGAMHLPDGKAWYEHALRVHTTTSMGAKEVHETGLAEVARIRAEMLSVIRRTDWFAADAARAKIADDTLFDAFVGYLRTDPRFYAKGEEELLARYRDTCKRIDAKLPALFGTLPKPRHSNTSRNSNTSATSS